MCFSLISIQIYAILEIQFVRQICVFEIRKMALAVLLWKRTVWIGWFAMEKGWIIMANFHYFCIKRSLLMSIFMDDKRIFAIKLSIHQPIPTISWFISVSSSFFPSVSMHRTFCFTKTRTFFCLLIVVNANWCVSVQKSSPFCILLSCKSTDKFLVSFTQLNMRWNLHWKSIKTRCVCAYARQFNLIYSFECRHAFWARSKAA